ncbi:MAG: RIP metalloprotease RseP [Acholeplasmataceae bacterium]|nr:MAG: RIP metalloprotease RseP [Acholeplasmataceae bacterium]
MLFLTNLLVFILVLGIIILVHEFGHFYMAKKAGILCHEFSIGMGPIVYQKRKGETVYSIRGIPIGGFVSMAGESISDALIKKGQTIGLTLNIQDKVTSIILNRHRKPDVIGTVVDYDLYGKEGAALFITLEQEGVATQYQVLRDARYDINDRQQLWITPAEKSFESKSLWQRFLVIFAGPFMNFVLAIALFAIIGFFVAKPDLESSVIADAVPAFPASGIALEPGDAIRMINGETIDSWHDLSRTMAMLDQASVQIGIAKADAPDTIIYHDVDLVVDILIAGIGNTRVVEEEGSTTLTIHTDEPIIGRAIGRAGGRDGLMTGDVIASITINNQIYAISDWDDIIAFFRTYDKGDITVTYLRNGQPGEATYSLISERAITKLGYQPINFTLGIVPQSGFDLLYTLGYPFRTFYQNTSQVLNTIGLLFDRNEQLGLGDLSGPVGIYSLVSTTRSQGLLSLLGFTAFLSINIGLLNLLPIPALDGGRLVFLGVEAVTRKPLNRKLENTINNLMFFLLLALFVFVTYNDILRLFGG